MRILLTGWLVLGLMMPSAVLLAENGKLTTEQRLQRLERLSRNQNMADMVYQLQQLKQEVQRLNGELELQKHAMDAMSRRQRDLYLDIDQRLSRVQPGGAPAVAPPVTAPPANATGVAPQPAPTTPPIPVATAQRPVNATPVTPPDPKKEAAAYQSAFNLLKQGRYPESIKAFSQFLENYSGGSFEDNAQYWLAEASYVNRDFDAALNDFSKVLSNHPQSPKVPGAMLKMGYIQYELKNWGKAREVLQTLQQEYAGSTEARLAEKRLQRMTKEGH
ncbi:MAG: tol-pal system protein YbgF [Candidatus Thiodiazotropha sp. (ex Monitilora ramsayi)]|nr:tol-pal system protein YbgF [Candidatus Thiodiazotropha sp. (ex Monitilora ramsayi)]